MANNIVLTSGRTSKTFTVKNFDTFSIDLDMPVTTFKMPEADSSAAQLIKVEGNFKTITVSWLLADDGNDVSGGDSIITVDQQMNYLLTQFETFGIADGNDTIAISGLTPAFSKNGKFVKILVAKDAVEPNNYRATVTLYEGSTVVTAED